MIQEGNQYQPFYNQAVLSQLIQQYKKAPQYFDEVAVDQMVQDAEHYGLPFATEAPFDFANTVKQVGAGFIEGFTTLKVGEEPTNTAERIAHNISHLAGFVGYIPKAPFQLLSKANILTKAADTLRGKSVPMLVANKAQEIATPLAGTILKKGMDGKAGAFKTVSEFLGKDIPSDLVEGAFHLGTASAVSSWQGGIDEMMRGFVGGAQAGFVFRGIGNLPLVKGGKPPKIGSKFFEMTTEQQQERIVKGMAASLFMGLTATMQGATTAEQVYEYVLGAYFGMKEMPAELRRRDRFIVKMFADKKNPTKVPELTEGFNDLSVKTQGMIKEEAGRIWDEQGKVLSKLAGEFLGIGVNVPSESATVKVVETPLPKTDRETSILRATEKGIEPTKEDWKKFSEEEKIYYSNTIDKSPLEGWYTKYQLNEFNKVELQAIAERLDVKNYKDMNEEMLKANIMYKQPKSTLEVVSRLKLNLEEDDVFVEADDVGVYTSGGKLPGSKLVNWVRRNMKKELEGLTPEESESKIIDISRFIGEKAQERMTEKEIVDADALATDLQNEYRRALRPEALGELRQLVSRANYAKQIPHMSVRFKNTEEGTTPVVEFLATKGHPITATGESKIQREPGKLWNDVWNLMTGEEGKSPFMVLDHVIEPGKRYFDTWSLFRYKEKLDKDPESDVRYNSFMFNVMKSMHTLKRNGKEEAYYYMGGAGDKEKAFFFRYHPQMNTGIQLPKILDALGDIGTRPLYRQSLDAYINKYTDNRFLNHATKTKPVSVKRRELDSFLLTEEGKQMKEMHDKAIVSNFLWEMSLNYGTVPVKEAELTDLIRHQVKYSQIQNAKGYNKRAQITMNSGYRGDGKYISELRDAEGNTLVKDFDPVTGYKFIIVPDAKKGFRVDSDAARKYIEHMDGAAILRDDAMIAENMDSGMPEPHKQGQSKSFIVSPDAKRGAVLGKYMFHAAGESLSEAMRKEGIHAIFPESALKQIGERKIEDYSFDHKSRTMKFNKDNIYNLPAEHIYRVYSEKQDRHYLDSQLFPSQGLSNLVTGVLDGKISNTEIKDMVDGLIVENFQGSTKANETVTELFRNPKSDIALTEFLREIDNVGVKQLLDILQTRGFESIAGKVYNHLMRVNDRIVEELVTSGEIDHRDAENAQRANRDFENLVDRLKIISEELSTEYKKAGVDYPVLLTHMHKFTNPYRMTVLKNYIVHRATRPKINNSIAARMRPYDKSMQQTINDGKGLEEGKFYLDEGFREAKIFTNLVDTGGREYITLGELWDRRAQMQANKLDIGPEFRDIFRSLGIRVPMDSMSGARAMEFGGFTRRKGYGVLLHPRVMRALGGADLDGDKAMIFFGGRSEDGQGGGMKQNWIDLYERNQWEFTRYVHKDDVNKKNPRTISKARYAKMNNLNEKAKYLAYTMDNKNERIPYGKHKGKTPREILAYTQYGDISKDFIDSPLGKYSPFLRTQMSEAASMGRMKLGSAVIAKKVIQGAHSSVMAMDNQTYRTIQDIYVPKIGNVEVETFLKANDNPKNTLLHRMMSQTGIALGSDPMDEIGLRDRETFFNEMYDPIFKLGMKKIWINGKEVKDNDTFMINKTMGNPNGEPITGRAIKDKYLRSSIYYNKLKKGGIIKDFYDTNNALFGRNWLEGRKHTYGEIKRKLGVLGRFDENTSNSVLPKVAKLLYKMDWNDRILNRLDDKGVSKVYNQFYKNLDKLDWLKKIMHRSSFAVKPDSRLTEVLNAGLWKEGVVDKLIYAKDKDGKYTEFKRVMSPLINRWTEDGKWLDAGKYFEIFDPVTRERVKFTFEQLADEEPFIRRSIRNKTGLSIKDYKRKLIRDLVNMEEGMIIQDLTDMVAANRIAKLASGLSQADAEYVINRANMIKMKYQHIGKENRKREVRNNEEEGTDVLEILNRGDKVSSEQTAGEMDAEIRVFKHNLSGSKEDVATMKQLFDTFFLGSLHRGAPELAKANLENIKKSNIPITPEIMSQIEAQKETATTSLLKIGYGSRAIGKESIKGFIREMNILFNKTLDIPTPREIAEKQRVATSEEPQVVEGVKIDLNEAKDPFQGIRGLANINETYKDLKPEVKKEYDKLEENLSWYHSSVGRNLNELTRGLLRKDLDAMNLEDWKNFNRFFKDLRTETTWDRMMHWFKGTNFVQGSPWIRKRFYHLFPESVNRQLMKHDFMNLEKKGAFLTKEGQWMTGKVMYPTHQVEKLVNIWSEVSLQSSNLTETYINDFKSSVANIVESIEEGTPLWRMMVRKRELLVADWIKREVLPKETDPARRTQLGLQMKNYIDAYNKEVENSKWNTLQDKEFQFTYKDDKGDTRIRRMTGREALDVLDKKMTAQAETMHKWLVGTPEFQEKFILKDKKGQPLYHGTGDKIKGNERMDIDAFVKWAGDKIKASQSIPMELGQDVLRKLSREVMYRMEENPAFKKKISEWKIFNTKSFPFEAYFPHISYDRVKVDEALKKETERVMNVPEELMDAKKKDIEIQKLTMRHKHLTGEWMFRDVEDWNYYDKANDALKRIGEKSEAAQENIRYFDYNQRTGAMFSRDVHLPGWSVEPRVIDTYIRNQVGTFHRQLGQILSRISIENFQRTRRGTYGEELTDAWMNFFKLQIQNSSGYPAKIPSYMLENPNMNLEGTPFAWWADNNVRLKINKIMGKLGLVDKKLPKELQGLSLQDIKNLSNLEAKYEMAALLAHPKTMFANIYGGTSLTISSVGLNNWKRGRDIKWLKSNINPGKDHLGNEWNNREDIGKYTTSLGIIPEMIQYELGLNPNLRTANFRKFTGDVVSKLKKDPEMSDKTLRQISREHGISDTFFDKASWFMRKSERILRRDAYMAHMVQAWESFGGQLPYNHPIIIEMAKKGVKATQFLYNAPNRPMFAQTALGKVMTRFQLWSWNSVRFRNDVIRQANIYGFRQGTEEFERFKRTAQIDLFMLGLSSVFAYSLFEAALPAPWNWFQDTADWIFGDEKERDRAFFGSWPTAVAPLQVVTPPILRMAPPTFRAFIDQDFTKLTDYYIWTMFPFGRMARDVAGPQNIIENPIRSVEKLTGLPYLQFHKVRQEHTDKEQTRTKGVFRW